MSAAIQTLWTELIAATLADAGDRDVRRQPGLALDAARHRARRRRPPRAADDHRRARRRVLRARRRPRDGRARPRSSARAAAPPRITCLRSSRRASPACRSSRSPPTARPSCSSAARSQTIDQVDLYGAFVRGAFDLGAPVGTALAMRAVRRKIVQAITLARGPRPGPVHIEVPLRKPLEPAQPSTDEERALARAVAELRKIAGHASRHRRLVADDAALDAARRRDRRRAARRHRSPARCRRALRRRETPRSRSRCAPAIRCSPRPGSQLRFGARPAQLAAVDHFDLVLGAPTLAGAPSPRSIIQLGSRAGRGRLDGGAARARRCAALGARRSRLARSRLVGARRDRRRCRRLARAPRRAPPAAEPRDARSPRAGAASRRASAAPCIARSRRIRAAKAPCCAPRSTPRRARRSSRSATACRFASSIRCVGGGEPHACSRSAVPLASTVSIASAAGATRAGGRCCSCSATSASRTTSVACSPRARRTRRSRSS